MPTYTNPTGNINATTGDDTIIFNAPREINDGAQVDGLAGQDSLTVAISSASQMTVDVRDTFDTNVLDATVQLTPYGPYVGAYNVESVDISGSSSDDLFRLKTGSVIVGLNVSMNGGSGWDRLEFDWSKLTQGISFTAIGSSITSSWGTFSNFEEFELRGGSGNDTITTGSGDDNIYGGTGNDVINAGGGDDFIYTESGGDTINGGAGYDFWNGNFTGTSAALAINIGSTITVSNGVSVSNVESFGIGGGSGDDSFTVTRLGSVTIYGSDGADRLLYDPITTQSVELTVSGYNGRFDGGGGDLHFFEFEILELHGGGADDSFNISGIWSASALILDGEGGSDRALLNMSQLSGATTFEVASNGTVTSNRGQFASIENYTLWAGAAADSLIAGAGTDVLDGGGGNDLLNGGSGNDFLTGGAGADHLLGGTGNDYLYGNDPGAAEADLLEGGYGDDIYSNIDRLDTIVEVAGAGRDLVEARMDYALPDNIEDLSLLPGSVGGVSAYEGRGNELANQITGNEFANVLYGFGGNDSLNGGYGNDVLIGGSGADVFVGEISQLWGDTIVDLEVGDSILFSNAVLGNFSWSVSGSILNFNQGGTLTLSGVTASFTASADPSGGVRLTATQITPEVRNDFNGDGRSDIYWRNTDGTIGDWLANANGSFTSNGSSISNIPAYWQIAGTGDFNGDGRDDILWRGNGGEIGDWLANSNGSHSYNAAAGVTVIPMSWQVEAIGDFNSDGKDDILWRNSDGAVGVWSGRDNGGFVANNAAVFNVSTDWLVVGTGDFNGDGKDDILWRHSGGAFADWLANSSGSFTPNGPSLVTISNDWHIIGTGDFNGDGRDDILWRHDSGTTANWLANSDGTFSVNFASLITITNDWSVAGTGDYNGDGRDDILWRHDSGTIANWLANTDNSGTFTTNQASFAGAPNDWQVQDPAVLLL